MNRRLLTFLSVSCLYVIFSATAFAADDLVNKIITEIKNHGHAMTDLEYMTDEFGPRLTGSQNLRHAQQWSMHKMREYGAENVHEEAYNFGKSWTRGNDYARLLTQSSMPIGVHAMAWNPPTNGPVQADLYLLAGPVDDAYAKIANVKGKIVVYGDLQPVKDVQLDPAARRQLRAKLFQAVKDNGAVAMLWSFEHEDGKYSMLGSPDDAYFALIQLPFPRIPFGFLQPEHYGMLTRMLKRGDKIRMELNLGGTFSPSPVQAYNVIGEIKGSEHPEQIVVVGGHLDSWDLATGATDNGTGSIATLETLRAIHALGLKPKRTIRFILFSGEEQGELGSVAYVKQHESELENFQAVLIDDLGAGKPKGWTVQRREDLMPYLARVIKPLDKLGIRDIPYLRDWDSDQDPFRNQGVPAFFLDQDVEVYFKSTHHSQVDTFDAINAEDYVLSVQAFAASAWQFAQLDSMMPHRKPVPDTD